MMQMAESKTISIQIRRSLRDVYDFTSPPESFAQWASGLGKPLGNEGSLWRFEGEFASPAALHQVPAAFTEFWREPRRPGPDTGPGRMMRGAI